MIAELDRRYELVDAELDESTVRAGAKSLDRAPR